jgi:Subtilase family
MARSCISRRFEALLIVACWIVVLCPAFGSTSDIAQRVLLPHELKLLEQAAAPGGARVLVTLNAALDTTSGASPLTESGRREAIASSQAGFAEKMAGFNATLMRTYDAFPIVLVNVDAPALQHILGLAEVRGVQEDHMLRPLDNSTNSVIHSTVAWANGYEGSGQVVAVLDTGVQATHPFLTTDGSTSRVIPSMSGCFSGDGASTTPPAYSNCPGDVASVTGSAIDGEACYNYPGYSGCEHGTFNAGIAAGDGFYAGGNSQGGVAPMANLMSVDVYTCHWNGSTCIETAYDADVIGGLNWVHNEWVVTPYFISSVVIAAGQPGADYTTSCDVLASAYKTAIDTLRNSDAIATIIASGNDGFTDGVDYPACVSSVLSVASTDDGDAVDAFSNTASFVSLYAPGDSVYSSIPTNNYAFQSGTSMAAAQVAGALALMEQRTGHLYSVTRMLSILQKTGKRITARGYTIPRIDIGAAYDVIFVDGFGG